MNLDDLILEDNIEEEPFVIVRLSTSWWKNRKGIHIKKSLNFMHRMSKGYNILEEDFDAIGGDIINKIINLNECKDGLYQIITCNEQKDWETGFIENYDYKLIPYKKENK